MEDGIGMNYSSDWREDKSIQSFGRRLEGKTTQENVGVNRKIILK
jgi:hypothetical protein